MSEQLDFLVCHSPEPPRHALRGDVLAIDAVDHPSDLEIRERPVDCRPRRLAGVALALRALCDAPADLEIRPGRRKPRSDPADESPAFPFLDGEHPGAMDRPVAGH